MIPDLGFPIPVGSQKWSLRRFQVILQIPPRKGSATTMLTANFYIESSAAAQPTATCMQTIAKKVLS